MEAILFCGIQATGKTTFFTEHFLQTHVRISLDLLNTRNRERRFLETCIDTQQAFVVDNTNPGKVDRLPFINAAKEAGYKVIGYYFQSKINDALSRNSSRTGKERIPEKGIRGTFGKLEIPSFEEGFDELYYVEVNENSFIINNWTNEI